MFLVHVLRYTVLIKVVHNVGARQHAIHLKPNVIMKVIHHNGTEMVMSFLRTCLFVSGSLLLFWYFLIDIEDAWDVELHAVEVISNHSPQLEQTRVTRLCNLRILNRYRSRITIPIKRALIE